jgi:hypothetical protein
MSFRRQCEIEQRIGFFSLMRNSFNVSFSVIYGYQEIVGALGDAAFYKFEKSTVCLEPWLSGPVCWDIMTEIGKEVYFHFACIAIGSWRKITSVNALSASYAGTRYIATSLHCVEPALSAGGKRGSDVATSARACVSSDHEIPACSRLK